MLRTNLATRPFYNERAVHVLLAVAALLVLGLSTFNAFRIISLSRANTELASRVNSEHQEADRLTAQAATIRRTINQAELTAVVEAASEANALIDRRTFSWTEFFNQIESTIPPDVMLTAVRPGVRNNVTVVGVSMLGRRAEDVDEFIEKLEATGGFTDCLVARQDMTQAALYQVSVDCTYTGIFEDPSAIEPVPGEPEAAAPATPEGGRR